MLSLLLLQIIRLDTCVSNQCVRLSVKLITILHGNCGVFMFGFFKTSLKQHDNKILKYLCCVCVWGGRSVKDNYSSNPTGKP